MAVAGKRAGTPPSTGNDSRDRRRNERVIPGSVPVSFQSTRIPCPRGLLGRATNRATAALRKASAPTRPEGEQRRRASCTLPAPSHHQLYGASEDRIAAKHRWPALPDRIRWRRKLDVK